jgi:anti-anti-sigma factor
MAGQRCQCNYDGQRISGIIKKMLPLRLRNGAIGASKDTISVGASLGVSSARPFARAISRMAQRRPSHVIIDMSKTRMGDSFGFGSLVAGLKKLGESGATPLLACYNPTVRRLMDFAVIARSVTSFDRVSDARRTRIEQTADALAS